MNSSLILVEILVALLGLGILMADLWVPAGQRRLLGWAAAANQPQALFALANAYELGNGVRRDPKAALDFYRRAALAGQVEARPSPHQPLDVLVQHLVDALGCRDTAGGRWDFRRGRRRLLIDDFAAELNALVADVDAAGASNQASNLLLALPAE